MLYLISQTKMPRVGLRSLGFFELITGVLATMIFHISAVRNHFERSNTSDDCRRATTAAEWWRYRRLLRAAGGAPTLVDRAFAGAGCSRSIAGLG